MMAVVACATVPKITLVIGGCYGSESYAMVRYFEMMANMSGVKC